MLRVVSLGTIVPDSHFVSTKLGQNYFLPNGFTVDRSIFKNTSDKGNASNAPAKKGKLQLPVEVNTSVVDRSAGHPSGLYFTATISAKPQTSDDPAEGKKGKGGPLYTVTRSDAPNEKRYEGESCSKVWAEALADMQKDFADRTAQLLVCSPASDARNVHGMDLFGVYLPDVVNAIAGLSGAADAAATVPAKVRKAKEKATTKKQGKISASPAEVEGEDTPLFELMGTTKAKKPRSSAAKTAAAAAASVPAPPAARLPCPDCGLVNTPFCAATGKPHVSSLCPKCGLSSSFCPVTGEAHIGVTQRENRQRGEVHLPGAKRSARKKAPAGDATVTGEAVDQVTVIATQQQQPTSVEGGDAPKKRPRRSSAKKATATATAEGGEATAEGAEGPAGEAGEGAAPKKRRTRSKKVAATAVGSDGGALAAPALAAEEATTTPAGGEAAPAPAPPAPPVPEEPKEYEYPPLRPPMSNNESHRALHIMQKALREQPEQQHLPACVAALRMPFISVRVKTGGATTKKRARNGKAENEEEDKVKQEENEHEDNDDANDESKANQNNNEVNAGEGDQDKEGPLDKDNKEQQNKEEETKGAATLQLSVHPLEVRDVGTSLAGKRYMKFMSQYTSERTKLDAIRKNSGNGAPKRGPQKSSAPEAVAGAEGEEEKKAAEATTGLVDRSDDISTVQLSAVKLEEPQPPTASVPQAEEAECGEDIAATQKIS